MSKYNPLWSYIESRGEQSFTLTFDEAAAVLGFEIDHSFLNSKKELLDYGYQVGKISLKNKTVAFEKTV
jgi:hypothetical protein